ncbi:transcription termination/antitermination protein NusG [Pararhizobium sp. O133]|uniref:transcription termination/antitermination protein NusG n=1 Tax=Pararhizobium sp. O133 TaxID=3449278 RepID=UPI003F687075
MTMQRKIEGVKIPYRPMTEAELSHDERLRAYGGSQRQFEKGRITTRFLGEASRDKVDSAPLKAKWFCLQLDQRREFTVEKALAEKNIEAFMPRETWVSVRLGRKIETVMPYFPGYMLVRIVPKHEAFAGLLRVKHVRDIVGGDTGYHVVHEGDVEMFKRICAKIDAPRIATDKTICEGSKADITDGPFAGFGCLVLSVTWSREARARVAIDVAGKVFEIGSMPVAFLKKL